jgi:D-glycero-D-manno-heptose 1,7-bisphosphate phosphatase
MLRPAGCGAPPMKRAVFLDRDGVINRAVVRNGKAFPPTTLEEFDIYPEAAEACARLKAAGFVLVVATNQPDVGRRFQKREVVEAMHARLCAALPIDRIEVCYDPAETGSDCYKPATGMLRRAARDLDLDLAHSYMVGDRWRDIDCGHAAGCITIFIDHGYSEALRQPPHFRAASLLEAAEIILSDDQSDQAYVSLT